MNRGEPKIPGPVQKRGSKTMEPRSGAGHDLCFTFFIFEASVVVGRGHPNEARWSFLAREVTGA